MKKYSFLLIVLLLSFFKGVAQQDSHYTLYMYNMNIVNPAYAGSTNDLNISVLGREQWVGIDGAPSTYTANVHSRIGSGVGLGLSLISDKIGPQDENSIFADVSYTLPVSQNGNLSFGLKLGGSLLSIDGNLLTSTTDPNLNQGLSKFNPNVGAGILYHTQKFYAGISVPNFLRTEHLDVSGSLAEEVEHYFVTSGYVFEPRDYLKIKPSTFIRFVPGAPVAIDLSLNALFYNKFELGLSHRIEDAVSLAAIFNLTKSLRLGYAYDYTLSELNEFSRGSHELMLLYKVSLSPKKIRSPRFF